MARSQSEREKMLVVRGFRHSRLLPKHKRDFTVRVEYYLNLRFAEGMQSWRPILSLSKDRTDKSKVVAWVIERANGGRGFGYTGGHFDANWEKDSVRNMLINAILWTAQAEVPPAY